VYCPIRNAKILLLKILTASLVVLGLFFPFFSMAASVVVTDIRIGTNQNTTRVVFDIDRMVEFKVFTLGDPYRVVIDLPEVGWRLPARPLPRPNGVFRELRYGLFKPGNSRVVLDINAAAEIAKAFILGPNDKSGYRLVVDLLPATPKIFKRDAGAPPLKVVAAQSTNDKKIAESQVTFASPKLDLPFTRKTISLSPKRMPSHATKLNILAQSSAMRLAPRMPKKRHGGKKKIIFIDAGHGGVDPGTTGISGVYEKHITLAMAKELKRKLEKTGRFKVLMSRKRDVFVRLRDRVRIARDGNAELFISVHADTVRNRKIMGPAVYTLSEKSSDKEAQKLAEKENKADLIAGVDLTHEMPEVTNILIDLAQRESMNQSARFATSLIRELKRKTRVLRNTHRFAGFAVLKAPDIPSVLLELGFLSNPTDERRLRSKDYRSKLASAVTKAVIAHFVRIEEATLK
jgi:N-acetylmuramoyl-L-alanine amidase